MSKVACMWQLESSNSSAHAKRISAHDFIRLRKNGNEVLHAITNNENI